MALQVRADPREQPSRGMGWSLRRYMAAFMIVLVLVAAIAAYAVRNMAEMDASQAAERDATFAAQAAATEIAHELVLARQSTGSLAANPQAAVVLRSAGASCSLTFSGAIG